MDSSLMKTKRKRENKKINFWCFNNLKMSITLNLINNSDVEVKQKLLKQLMLISKQQIRSRRNMKLNQMLKILSMTGTAFKMIQNQERQLQKSTMVKLMKFTRNKESKKKLKQNTNKLISRHQWIKLRLILKQHMQRLEERESSECQLQISHRIFSLLIKMLSLVLLKAELSWRTQTLLLTRLSSTPPLSVALWPVLS